MSNTLMLAESCFTVKAGSCGAWGYRSWGMHGINPFRNGINVWDSFGTLEIQCTAGSFHVGGCYFAMGDGTVRFINQEINSFTLLHMSTIADGIVADSE